MTGVVLCVLCVLAVDSQILTSEGAEDAEAAQSCVMLPPPKLGFVG